MVSAETKRTAARWVGGIIIVVGALMCIAIAISIGAFNSLFGSQRVDSDSAWGMFAGLLAFTVIAGGGLTWWGRQAFEGGAWFPGLTEGQQPTGMAEMASRVR